MATGTKLMKEISDQFLVCQICREPFKEPKTLSCLHTFCCACVQQQYDNDSNRPTRYTLYARSVTCPVCRKKTDLPTGGVRRLPDNFLVSNLTEVLAKRCVSKVPPCEICQTVRHRSSDACSKCLDCDKLLCRACVDLHTATKVTQDHSLIDLEGQKDIECKVHPQETVRFYCEKCEECICVVCTFQEHKDHDVCSFNDGFAKHKIMLENLLSRSKERMTDVASRLKVIERYETLSRELKERIRDLAISYTSQVRAREKELIKRVDELFSGEVAQLAEKKSWLQESFDSLQSACNLTEIVIKDKGVEMLLLKKEIQGKMDHLLDGMLPPDPSDLQSLDVRFVPGEVKLGEVYVPGHEQEVKGVDRALKTTSRNVNKKPDTGTDSTVWGDGGSRPCTECIKRKQREERGRGGRTKEEERKATKSVYIQTKPVVTPAGDGDHPNGYLTTTASQMSGVSPSDVNVSHNSIQTHTATVSSRHAGTDSTGRHDDLTPQPQGVQRARGTMTEIQNVRSLKIQTEESCLRDTHLEQAAATGGLYPNTGAAIAAACLRHKPSDETLTRSWPLHTEEKTFPAKDTQDAEVATDISLGLISTTADTVTALRRGEVGVVGVGVSSADCSRPDLLAETGVVVAAPAPAPRSPSSPWIRSRKIQTEISALAQTSDKGEPLTDEELRKSLFAPRGSDASPRKDSVTLPESSAEPVRFTKASRGGRSSMNDVGVMTSFKVKIVPNTVDRETLTQPVTSCGVSVMTSPDTRAVYIQTHGPLVTSTATGTDNESQISKGTSTALVTSADAETTMPQVLHESRTTWTDDVVTTERATSTVSPATSDTGTLTSQVERSDFSMQMRPQSVVTGTCTEAPCVSDHQSQTTPNVTSRGTMPDPVMLRDTPSSSSATSLPSSSGPASSCLLGASTLTVPEGPFLVPPAAVAFAVSRAEKGTETVPPSCSTVAVGPNSQMQSSRTASTDTLHLLQVTDKETSTPTVKTVDEWTYTLQPQMVNTGVTPPRPAVLEAGVATTPITLMDQATYTEVKTFRESGTESGLVVCDNETLTERIMLCDAQTGAEVNTENQGTTMEVVKHAEGSCMTDEVVEKLTPRVETKDSQSQCLSPTLLSKEVNTTRYRRKAKEAQTSYSYMECLLCQHPDKLEQLGVTKTFTDTSTDPSPPDTHDVATMALSCLASSPGITHTGVQTSAPSLSDKSIATSFDFDEDFPAKPFLGLESQDAATSTESLPYIGLLSEIDVDELIVIPEANFELVSDSDDDSVPMVDGETLTEMFDYVEVGTQTLLPSSGTGESLEQSQVLFRPEDDCSKHLVSIGVNTMPKVTFEKETSTPIRHLFSKGTMTFFVAKMDKATSTISHTRSIDNRSGAAPYGGAGGRVVKEASKQRAVNNKVTMTNRAEQRDMAVETDTTFVDGRITQCISKLRNVSERLNSPTLRKNADGEVFFGQSFLAGRQKDSGLLHSPTSPKFSSSPILPASDIQVSPQKDVEAEEQQRQKQLSSLLAETNAVLKNKDLSPVRKAQPITTLKPRSPVTPGEVSHYVSKSLPRPRSLDRQNKVKMGSQTTAASRLPLLRYNSAPGRIATVPAQTLLLKTGQTSPRTSPSKIPVSQKQTSMMSSTGSSDSGPDSDTYSTSSSQKIQQRPPLPSISETRTPSSCSESSFVSLDSRESSLNPASVMTTSHSRTPSDATSEAKQVKSSVETVSSDVRESTADDSSSVSSTSTTVAATPPQASGSSHGSRSKQKKEKMGFMQRLLSGKKKKDTSNDCDKDGKQETASTLKPPQQASPQPSPQTPKKQTKSQQGAKSKHSKSGTKGTSSSSAEKPSPQPGATSESSRPSSMDSTHSAQKGWAAVPEDGASAAAAAAATPAKPPHHYPPLPDPNKTPPPPPRPRPFVYVRQRIFSIQQDNVEEAKERKEKEKEEKEKGKTADKSQVKVKGVTGKDQVKVDDLPKVKEKDKEKASVKVPAKVDKETQGKDDKDVPIGEKVKGAKIVKKSEFMTVFKSEKSEAKDKTPARKPRGWMSKK